MRMQLPYYARQLTICSSRITPSGGSVKNEQRVAAYKRQGNRSELTGRQKRRIAKKERQGKG